MEISSILANPKQGRKGTMPFMDCFSISVFFFILKSYYSIYVMGLGGRKACRNNQLLFLSPGRITLKFFLDLIGYLSFQFDIA
jgi:hypothetical protein